ncbi:MAG: hypothetical protein VW239_06805 [Candidatus Nanopelagicales bacterium]
MTPLKPVRLSVIRPHYRRETDEWVLATSERPGTPYWARPEADSDDGWPIDQQEAAQLMAEFLNAVRLDGYDCATEEMRDALLQMGRA